MATRQIITLLGLQDATAFTRGSADASTETWATRLAQIEQVLRHRGRPDFQILIDREEFRRLGVTSSSELPPSRFETPRLIGTDRLKRFGLAIVVDGDRAVFTSSSELREFASQADFLFDVAVEGSTGWFAPSRLIGHANWSDHELDGLWTLNSDTLEVGLQAAGWKSFRQEVGADETPLKIYHRDTVIALSCSIFVFGVAVGWWTLRSKRRRWLLILAVALALAEVLPQPGATLAVAVAWGFLVSGIYRVVAAPTFAKRSVRLMPFRRSSSQAAIVIFVIASWLVLVDRVSAQDSEASDVTDHQVERVIFPRDEDGQLLDYVYLTPTFHRTLKQETTEPEVPGQLFRRGSYHAVYRQLTEPMVEIRVEYRLTTLLPNQTIKLPPFGAGVSFDEASVELEHRPVSWNQGADGSLSFQIERAGDYQLQFVLRQEMRLDSGTRRCRVRVPKIAQSDLTFEFPRNATSASSPSALGLSDVDLERGMLRADMGPAAELVLHLSLDDAAPEYPQLDQLMLVQFVDAEVFVETRFRFADEPAPLRLDVDAGWEPTVSHSQMVWDAETSQMELAILGDEMGPQFQRAWPIQGGRFRIPQITPHNATLRSRKVAVVVPPSTRTDVLSDNVTVLTKSQFAESWGTLDVEPEAVLQIPVDEEVHLQVVAADVALTWNDETSYFFNHDRVFFRTNLELRPDGSSAMMEAVRRLRLPKTLEVSEIIATNSFRVPLRLRWRQLDEETYALLFLDQPEISSSAPLEIVIRGELLHGRRPSDLNLPLVTPRDSRNVSELHQVLLYAAPNVELRAAPNASLSARPDDGAADPNGYRFVGSWTSGSADSYESGYAFSLSVISHHRQLNGSLTTRLQNETDQWIAEATVTLDQPDAGDALFFELPADLVTTTPAAYENDDQLRVDEAMSSPAVNRRLVTVWLPPPSTSGRRSISLVASMDQEQTRLPHLQILNVELRQQDKESHFVELPNTPEMDDSRFTWNHFGLVEEPSGPEGNYRRYRVAQENYGAILDEVESGSQQAEVYLLETVLRWTASNQYLAISTFDIKPAAESVCFADLPRDAELLSVFVDDRRMFVDTSPSKKDRASHRIPLASQPWPQRVRVSFRGTLKTGYQGDVQLLAPRLLTSYRKPIAVLKEFWTVYGPNDVGVPRLVDTRDRLQDPAQRSKSLVVAFTDLWAGSQTSIRERSKDEKSAWLRPWAGRLRNIVNNEERFAIWDDDDQLRPYHQLVADYQDIFNPITPPPMGVSEHELWNESQWMGNSMLLCVSRPPADQDLPSLRLRYPRSQGGSQPIRVLVGLVLIGAAILIPRWARIHDIVESVRQRPYVLGVVLGVAWWFFLAPYWLGALFVLIFIGTWTAGLVRRQRRLLSTRHPFSS